MTTDTITVRTGDVYDWWSRHPSALQFLYTAAFLGREDAFRRRARAKLDPSAGERVLELGCGLGNEFDSIRHAIGSTGTLVGVDASRGMVQAARDRVTAQCWENVHVCLADARRLPVRGASMDAAYAAMSLSAVADPTRAVQSVKRVLRPGGRFVVLDARPFQEFPWTLINPLVEPIARRTTNWVPEIDFVAALRREFERVEVTSYNGGSIVIACAEC